MKKIIIYIYIIPLIIIWGCVEKKTIQEVDSSFFHSSIKKTTDIIIHDIFSPPVASRIYAYSDIAAYETIAMGDSQYVSLSGQINGLDKCPPPTEKNISFSIAALQAYTSVAKTLIFSEDKMEKYQQEMYEKIRKNGVDEKRIQNSILYGNKVAEHILAWGGKDNYKQTRSFPKYSIQKDAQYWKPTPPDYMEGVEPHWNKIRPISLDSPSQFSPPPPIPFSKEKNSTFYQNALEVYTISKNLTPEQRTIASFWDCNPYVSHHKGHAMFATKKMTPGGHWMSITSLATKMKNTNFSQTVEAYTRVSIALFDGFISCWDEKWKSILVRPETYINENIDTDWVPLLQTPPFPEYTSGHSVISGASATVLTDMFGEKFPFVDSSEVEFGLTVRSFESFIQACDEATLSRIYGGIHYRPALTEGLAQGKRLGKWIHKTIHTKK